MKGTRGIGAAFFDKNDESGKAITYTIREDPVKDYTTTYSGLDVTNYHRPTPDMSVLIKKEWRGLDSEHPSVPVKVQLFRDGKAYLDPVTLSADNNWQYLYTGLAIKNESGAQYAYTAEESPVPDGFSATYSYSYNSAQRRLTITVRNSRADHVIGGNKYWDDNDDYLKRRPKSVTFEIIATVETETENGKSKEQKVVDTKVLNATTGWKWSGAYPEKDELGRAATYDYQYPVYASSYGRQFKTACTCFSGIAFRHRNVYGYARKTEM